MNTLQQKKKVDYTLILVAMALIAIFTMAEPLIKKYNEKSINYVELDANGKINTDKLIISEIMSNNSGTYVNGSNNATDYIELYNGSADSINLAGYGLSDKDDKIKYIFGDVTIGSNDFLVVSLTGQENKEGYANFKLSSKGGETVILTNPGGRVIDSVTTVFLGKGEVMVRKDDKSWAVSNIATPGKENSLKGLENYYTSLFSNEEQKLLINEVLIANKGNYKNKNGRYDGFIEIKNISDSTVNLKEYCLSNSKSVPFKYSFDDVVLKPGQLYVVYAGDGDYLHQDYLGFNFTNKDGVIVLSHNGKIVQELIYSDVPNGESYIFEDGSYYVANVISEGYDNDISGVKAFQLENMKTPAGLVINEVMNKNGRYLAQNGSNYYDWIELYNHSDISVKLSDYYLGLSDTNLYQFQLPDIELQPDEYYVVMCSGNPELTTNNYVHTNFKLGSSESIYLSTEADGVVDSLFVCELPANYSYGRGTGCGVFFMDEPSPKAKNILGKEMLSSDITFSEIGGIYDGVSSVIVALNGDGVIRYTTDGSEPTLYSKKYSNPITLYETTVLKARTFSEDSIASKTFVQTYIIGEEHSMDVVSISLDPYDFEYINTHYELTYDDNSQSATKYGNIELLSKNEAGFNSPCAIAVGGGFGKTLEKKSYSIKFTKGAGQSDLEYPVFSSRDCKSYDSLFLRSSSTDWEETLIKDILATSLVDEYTDLDVQAYRPVVLYVNGSYWGVYSIREKINEHFIEAHYNVDTDDLNIVDINEYAKYGSYDDYAELRKFARTHNLAIKENYDYMCEKMDIPALVDYWICEAYTANFDFGNVRYFSSPYIKEGRYIPIFFDLDHGFHDYVWHVNSYTFNFVNPEGMGLYPKENDIIRALFDNEQFRQLWLKRLDYHLRNTFAIDNVLKRIDELYDIYQPEMVRDCYRWGHSYYQWEENIEGLRCFARNKTDNLLSQTQYYFGYSYSQMKKLFPGLY